MRKFIIAISIFTMPYVAYGDKLNLVFHPNGPRCNHVRLDLTDDNGKVLKTGVDVINEPDLFAPIDKKNDSDYLIQAKIILSAAGSKDEISATQAMGSKPIDSNLLPVADVGVQVSEPVAP